MAVAPPPPPDLEVAPEATGQPHDLILAVSVLLFHCQLALIFLFAITCFCLHFSIRMQGLSDIATNMKINTYLEVAAEFYTSKRIRGQVSQDPIAC